MLNSPSLNYEKDYFQSFLSDVEVNYQTKNLSDVESNDSTPMSLSLPETANYSQDEEQCSQFCRPTDLPPRVEGDLYSTYVIPEKYRYIFSAYPCFNSVQTKVLDDVLYSEVPIVVSAPTGSGKTVIFELAIIRLLMKLEDLKYAGEFKIVYMAPVKALCSERFCDWKVKFSSLGINCQEVTGDADDYDLSNLSRSHLILTTPEKWDSLTRKWKDNTKMVQLVKLFLIDEVHLLSEEKRGPTLEAVVSRMKTIKDVLGATWKQKLQHKNSSGDVELPIGIRFVAVSATIYNIEDVANWLGTLPDSPAKHFKISEDQRPVKLNKIVLGYPCSYDFSQFRFEISLSFKLKPLLFKYADGKPTLIFCSTRKGVDQTCSTLNQQITFSFSEEHHKRLLEAAQILSENKLKSYIVAGVGYHHAGMDRNDRHTVENLFRAGLLPVLVTTSTLAIGVNLPAHLVIIKATQQYAGGAYHDYTETQILQMIGRAGRPQYDTSAVAIIMTKESQKSRYENLIEGKEPLESNLHRHLAEHLNAEVVLHTITEVGQAMEWIRSTFLYVRALQNPCYYGIPAKLSKKGIETKLQEMCQRELHALASANLLTVDNLTDIRPTANGVIMARFYLGLGTMKIFNKITGKETLEDVLKIVAACDEFSGLKLRVNEKKNLNLLNKSKDRETIRFPLQGKITNTEMKVNCLIQALFGCLPVYEQSLKQDTLRIAWTGERVTMALGQYLQQFKYYKSLLYTNILAKCFRCKLWENSPYVSRQLRGIGPALSSLLVASQKTSFKAIAESNPRDIELILNRAPPMGDALKTEVSHLPKFELKVLPMLLNPNLATLDIYVEMTNKDLVQEYNAAGVNHWLVLIIGDSNNKCLLIERFRDICLLQESTFFRSVTVKHTPSIEIYINLVSEHWAGIDVSLTTKFDEPPPAKHSLDKYLVKIGIDARGKSPLQLSSEAATLMNKRKRNSLSQEIKAIDAKSPFLSNRLTLDNFKFTPVRNKKLISSQQHIFNNKYYQEQNDNFDKSTPSENINDVDEQSIIINTADMHMPYDVEQLNVSRTHSNFETKNALHNTPNNFTLSETQHFLKEKSENNHGSFYCDNTFKSKNSHIMEKSTANNVSTAEKTQSKLYSSSFDRSASATREADAEGLYTEPSETPEVPYITHLQGEITTSKQINIKRPLEYGTSHDIENNANRNTKGWTKIIETAKLNESHHVSPNHFTLDNSCFTEGSQSNQSCNTKISNLHYKPVKENLKPLQAMGNYEVNKPENILQYSKFNNSFQSNSSQLAYSTSGSPETVDILSSSSQRSASINLDENYLHGDNEGQQKIISNMEQFSQQEHLLKDDNISQVTQLSNKENYHDIYKKFSTTTYDTGTLLPKTQEVIKDGQMFKRTLPKHFYPIFMKSVTTDDNQDRREEKESKDVHEKSIDSQMETSFVLRSPKGQLKERCKETAIELQCVKTSKNITKNQVSTPTEVENNVGRIFTTENSMDSTSFILQQNESEYQQNNNSGSETNNELQYHPTPHQYKNTPTKSTTESIHDTRDENKMSNYLSQKAMNMEKLATSPDFSKNCDINEAFQKLPNFSLVADFDRFFEKLSSEAQNSKDKNVYSAEAEQINMTPRTRYNKSWVREYLFSKRMKTINSNENTKLDQHSNEYSSLQKQNLIHHNVPAFVKDKTANIVPLKHMEISSEARDQRFSNNVLQSKKATYTCLKKNMAIESKSNYNDNQTFTMIQDNNKGGQHKPNKSYFNFYSKPKHRSILSYTPVDKHRKFVDRTQNAPICNITYSLPPASSEVLPLYSESSQRNKVPCTLFKFNSKQQSNETFNTHTANENSCDYAYSDSEESSNIFDRDTSSPQPIIFNQPSTYAQYQANFSPCLKSSVSLEVADEGCIYDPLEEEIQDYEKCASPIVEFPLLSKASPQNSDHYDLPSPPLVVSSDESGNCSECSTCQTTSTVKNIQEYNEQQLAIREISHFPINNIPLSLPTQSSAKHFQQIRHQYPKTQQNSDSEYKRPRSIYLPNDKLQKFHLLPERNQKRFSLYNKLKLFPR